MFSDIITLEIGDMNTHSVRFQLHLDWRGRAQLDATQPADPYLGTVIKTYYLPFEESTYRMVNGEPVIIENTK